MRPKQTKGLVPAKNGKDIGLANEEQKKFFKLNNAYLQVWLLCDGKRDEGKITDEFIKIMKKAELEADIDRKVLKQEIKNIINRLLKFGLLEQ